MVKLKSMSPIRGCTVSIDSGNRLITIYSMGRTLGAGCPSMPFCASMRTVLRGRSLSIMRVYLPRCLRCPIAGLYIRGNIRIFRRGPLTLSCRRNLGALTLTRRDDGGVNIYFRGHCGRAFLRLGELLTSRGIKTIAKMGNLIT